MGVYMFTCLMWIFTYEGRKLLTDMITLQIKTSDGKDCTSCWFHMDYFITEYLFLI